MLVFLDKSKIIHQSREMVYYIIASLFCSKSNGNVDYYKFQISRTSQSLFSLLKCVPKQKRILKYLSKHNDEIANILEQVINDTSSSHDMMRSVDESYIVSAVKFYENWLSVRISCGVDVSTSQTVKRIDTIIDCITSESMNIKNLSI